MLTLSCHHPEVLDFATCKKDKTKVTGANISIRLSDEFLAAVRDGTQYEQRWPVTGTSKIRKMMDARTVWRTIIETAWATGEPGLLFWDRILRESPADCYESYQTISTNPCAELPLSVGDSCRLLVLNLMAYVRDAFTPTATFDFKTFTKDAMLAQRLMDDIVDLELEAINRIIRKIESDPEEPHLKTVEHDLWLGIREACVGGRRTGTGITALGDTIAAVGLRYGSDVSIELAERIYRALKLACYRSSVEMAKVLGPFPVWDPEKEVGHPFLCRIREDDPELYMDMMQYGRRNIALLTTAPAGTVSTQTQTTSGIEPAYQVTYRRRKKITPDQKNARVDFVDDSGDRWQEFDVYHHGLRQWMTITGKNDLTESPYHGATANEIDWRQRVELQAKCGTHIDHSISSCVSGDTLIQTDGGLFTAEELAGHASPKQFAEMMWPLRSINQGGELVAIDQAYNNGVASTVSIRMSSNREIVCTPSHKLTVLDENYDLVWKEAINIEEGDTIVGRKGLKLGCSTRVLEDLVGNRFEYVKRANAKDVSIPTTMSPGLARLLGYMCSDGSLSVNSVLLSQLQNNVCADFEQLMGELFGVKCNTQYDHRAKDLVNVVANGREIVAFMKWLGISGHDDMRVPLAIRRSGTTIVSEFIKGLTLDGHVTKNGVIVMTSICRPFLEQVRHLLLNLGIEGNILQSANEGCREFPSGKVYQTKQSWTLSVLSGGEVTRFMEMIGFAEDRKNQKAACFRKRSSRISRHGEVPDHGLRLRFRKEVLTRIRSTKLYDAMHSATIKDKRGRLLPRERILEMVDLGLTVPEYLVDSTYTFHQVQSVGPGTKVPTYDLSVPDGHCYLANGVLSHNTVNLPSNATIEDVALIYETAWAAGCKGITVYRDGCRDGVLISDKPENPAISKTDAVKRPRKLECDVHGFTVGGVKHFALVSKLGGEPYEIFAGAHAAPKVAAGICERVKRGHYRLTDMAGEVLLDGLTTLCDNDQEAVLRMASTALRHGCPLQFLVEQLEKSKGDLHTFSKGLVRVLKKYLKDGSKVNGSSCPACHQDTLIRQEGCQSCSSCSWSKC